jgi:hypothetical protein
VQGKGRPRLERSPVSAGGGLYVEILEPVLRLLTLQRRRCSWLQRFFKVEDNYIVFKAY